MVRILIIVPVSEFTFLTYFRTKLITNPVSPDQDLSDRTWKLLGYGDKLRLQEKKVIIE